MTAPEQAMTVVWGDAVHRYRETVEVSVKVAGVPDIMSRKTRRHYAPYSVRIVHVRFGADSRWNADATVYGHKVGGSGLVGTPLVLSQLDEIPQWLTDLIEQATPKDDAR